MIRLLASSLIAATLVTAAPAMAQETAPSRIVRYADLDLATAAGQHTLDERVMGAIRAVCPQPSMGGSDAVLDYQRCRVAAKIAAHTQVAMAVDNAVRLAAHDDGTIRLASR